jgi:hypothetical protein
MRTAIYIAFSAFLVSTAARAQQPPATSSDGLSCFENLGTPDYPKAALDSHVDGSIWTWTHVSAQGVPEKIDTNVVSAWGDGGKLLTPAVEKAIRAAKIKPECDGKTVWAVFRYQFYGEATPQPKITASNEGPNLLVISSEPNPVSRRR